MLGFFYCCERTFNSLNSRFRGGIMNQFCCKTAYKFFELYGKYRAVHFGFVARA